jgi:hypothetical protein
MNGLSMFPLISFDLIENRIADQSLVEWGHWLGGCNRPFGRQSFGLFIENQLRSVAVSASTVNAKCGGYDRQSVVELARLCSHPDHRDLTRVALRLWRVIGPVCWSRHFWPVVAAVSYSNAIRHTGDIYRFDGWRKVCEVSGGTAGTTWKRPRKKTFDAKVVWAFDIKETTNGNEGNKPSREVKNLHLPDRGIESRERSLDMYPPEWYASPSDERTGRSGSFQWAGSGSRAWLCRRVQV